MNEEQEQRITQIEQKLDAVYVSVEKTRKYILITAIVSIAMVVLPLIALAFVVPMVFNTLSQSYGGIL